MKRRGRSSVGVALFLCVVSIVAPLFARLCFKCPEQIDKCKEEQKCEPVATDSVHPICKTCQYKPNENECPEEYYCCTACAWRIYNCEKPDYSLCADPPYISKREEEEDVSTKRYVKCVKKPDGTYDCKEL